LADFALVDMPLSEIFKAVAIIEPMAYTVWKNLLESFPKSHFSALIFEYANADKDDSSHYEKLMEIVEESQKRNREKQ
jgi:hypothetical protein